MAINIQNVVNILNNRIDAGSSDPVETVRLTNAQEALSYHVNANVYERLIYAGDPDDNRIGEMIAVDSAGTRTWFVNHRNSWVALDFLDSSYDQTYTFQGENYGFISGGTQSPGVLSSIESFSFSNFTPSISIGNLTEGKYETSGQSSFTHGYVSAGDTGTDTVIGTIEKFRFVEGGSSTVVGSLATSRMMAAGHSSIKNGKGYVSGGNVTDPSPGTLNTIETFLFSNETDLGTIDPLTYNRYNLIGISGDDYGYSAGGYQNTSAPLGGSGTVSRIERFAFNNPDYVTAQVGNLSTARQAGAGLASYTHGYVAGGTEAANLDVIDRFPFASNGNASDVGDMVSARRYVTSQSSEDNGYITGGFAAASNIIESFPFASTTTNSTNVGSLSVARSYGVGQQY